MFSIRVEGSFTEEQEAIIRRLAGQIPDAVNFSSSVGDSKKPRWFGEKVLTERRALLEHMVGRMARYVNDQCLSLTFVKKQAGGFVQGCAVPQGTRAGVGHKKAFIRADENSWAYGHQWVPSGIRVYLLDGFFTNVIGSRQYQNAGNFMFAVMMHELTHRIIGTFDHWYNSQLCLAWARQDDPDCISCAENWGFFYAEVYDALAKERKKAAAAAGQSPTT